MNRQPPKRDLKPDLKRSLKRELWISFAGHCTVLFVGLLIALLLKQQATRNPIKKTIAFRVNEIEKLKEEMIKQDPPKPVPIPLKPVDLSRRKVDLKPAAKPVFGVNEKKTWTEADNKSSTTQVELKAGNTLAKAEDNEKLSDADSANLPIPTDDYLVSRMPKMKSEFRITYPALAKQNNIQGDVTLSVLIDQSGKVRKAKALEGPGYGLNEAAEAAMLKFEFDPAYVNQKPVAVEIRYRYKFVLD